MSTLPFEILTLTFGYLKTKDELKDLITNRGYFELADLLQCQLTSKEWYQASVDLIYSEVDISTSERSCLFGRTISNSLHLAACLKIIRTKRLFTTKKDNQLWDQHGLLNKLFEHCPNILEIQSMTQDYSFWYRISYAATRGHLSRLQVLPGNGSWNLEPYIHTALHFKSSLTHLRINDKHCILGADLNSLGIYQELLDQIGEFKKLQTVELFYQSDKQLSCFDTLIDNCPHLKEVNIKLVSKKTQRMVIEHEGLSISSRPDIRKLQCNWDTISTEKQIRYITHKFPNLQSLKIDCFYFSKHVTPRSCPSNALIDFLHYATAIPEFEINLTLRYQDLTNIVTELINMKDIYRDISISFACSQSNVNGPLLKLKATTLEMEFLVPENIFEYPWAKFFLETGNKIRSLTIKFSLSFFKTLNNSYIVTPIDTACIAIDDIFEMIQACPLLEKFTMSLAGYYGPTKDRVLKVANIKKLTVIDIGTFGVDELPKFLRFASQKLPNIKQLHLKFNGNDGDIYDPMVIDMKRTQLDLLILTSEDPNYKIDANLVVYIKLKTVNNRLKYYIGNKTGLLPIKVAQYKHAVQEYLICFDITCQALIEFRIATNSSPSLKFSWIF